MDILPVFCDIDDFRFVFEPRRHQQLLSAGERHRRRSSSLALSEVMTIIVLFHASGYRDFKTFYTQHVQKHLLSAFPRLTSYNRFVELMRDALIPLSAYLETLTKGCAGRGIAFVDSTSLRVCHNRRIHSHRVFRGIAARGKTSVGWFYGFKLHLCINECGELFGVRLTPGNTDDRRPVPGMVKELSGKLIADKGYISGKLTARLCKQGLELVTKIKSNMRQKFISVFDKLLLRKRAIIESVIDQLKNISNIEHSRHRSLMNFIVNVVAGLIAYTFREKKPMLNIEIKELALLTA